MTNKLSDLLKKETITTQATVTMPRLRSKQKTIITVLARSKKHNVNEQVYITAASLVETAAPNQCRLFKGKTREGVDVEILVKANFNKQITFLMPIPIPKGKFPKHPACL